MVNRSFIFAAALCILGANASCSSSKHSGSSAKMPGNWQSQSVVINGENSEWPSPYPSYDANAMIGYAI
ncbi:MAG: hypothetical protein JSS96_16685, partial [Bacteroidetes bacterium]|nr:hypothetical protein [Bacteroidota bacterium]